MLNGDDIHPEFQVHKLTPTGLDSATEIALIFNDALNNLMEHVPEGRYLSLVKTKLEEACFFAKKGLAVDPDNQE